MMELLTALSARSGDQFARTGGGVGAKNANSKGEGGPLGSSSAPDGQREDFVAKLAALLGRPSGEAAQHGDATMLAELGDAEGDDAELPLSWPLGLLHDLLVDAAPADASAGSTVDSATIGAKLAPTEPSDAEPLDGTDEPVPGLATMLAPVAGGGTIAGDEPTNESTPPLPPTATSPDVDPPADAAVDDAPADATIDDEGAVPLVAGSGEPSTGSDDAEASAARTASDRATAAPERAGGGLDGALRVVDGASTSEADDEVIDAQRPAPRPGAASASSYSETARTDTVPLNGPSSSDTPGPSFGRSLGMADGVRRVLEVVELLEQAPPPRQLTIDVGDARIRVALEEGAVRVTVLDGASEETDELLRSAEQALAEQGFDLGRDGDRDDHPDGEAAATPAQRQSTRRAAGRGLRL